MSDTKIVIEIRLIISSEAGGVKIKDATVIAPKKAQAASKSNNGKGRGSLWHRVSVEALQVLEKAFAFKANISNTKLAAKAGVTRENVASLRRIERDRPELLAHIFADQLSIHVAERMRSESDFSEPPLTPSRITNLN